ncbi:hypothetical protein [Leeuwenhoekiella parthenopeia]|uniref:Uncharacterized protein n=1 Tax=Leeuwenhoekiella parthenopeia TaxID=2890320 RepID=A0ABS8GS23_9FLAO|nr:hypothetical protein [Leeuwenhoekiella parthenopeia]MCC4212047.1 hypothetical protein [Leeuwenhoekiella parthenopeia]
MKTENNALTSNKTETFQLIDGEFSPAEASTVIMNLLDEKINFHKIRKLQIWEKDHTINTDKINARIEALEAEKAKAQQTFKKLAQTNTRLKVDGAIKITLL